LCGIVGYTGEENAAPILLKGLRKMEYRGYDSAGVATVHRSQMLLRKDSGRVDVIAAKHNVSSLLGKVGVAHTRWATHGAVNQVNAHPHLSCGGEVAIVHNGIIENYAELRRALVREGHKFKSETDSEVIAHLLEKYLREPDIKAAVKATCSDLKGQFAFAAIFKRWPKVIVGARNDAPLIIGTSRRGHFLASDAIAFAEYTDRAVFLDNREFAVVNPHSYRLYTFEGKPVVKKPTQIAWEVADLGKGEYTHYTLKEIHEQPVTLAKALTQNQRDLDAFLDQVKSARRVYITGAGTSFHAGLVAKHHFLRSLKIPTEAVLASEFSEHLHMLDDRDVIVAISQSGETADVLEAVKIGRERGARILALVNTFASSLARISDLTLYLNCGPEIGVAATKSFTSQLSIILRLVAGDRIRADQLSSSASKVLKSEDTVIEIAKRYAQRQDFYLIGRGVHYPIALEGALKLKELAYVHAEGMAAGELKHGTLALVSNGTPAVVLNPTDDTYTATLNNALEMKARGAKIIGISDRFNEAYDEYIPIENGDPILYPILEVIPLQLLAYYCSLERKSNPDYPRNLAKSVTVK